ncbi:MAG: hypothetical protein ABJF07_01930 [Nisaea sp.]
MNPSGKGFGACIHSSIAVMWPYWATPKVDTFNHMRWSNFEDHMRIAIIGNAGSGKSTLAVKLSRQLDIPVCEIDKLLWQEGWVPAPRVFYEEAHNSVIRDDNWIIEGLGMLETIDQRIDRANHVIFCDFPLWQHFWLLAERQLKWAHGTLELPPGGQKKMPPTQALFETVWRVDRDWMPTIRGLVSDARQQKSVQIIASFEELENFEFVRE